MIEQFFVIIMSSLPSLKKQKCLISKNIRSGMMWKPSFIFLRQCKQGSVILNLQLNSMYFKIAKKAVAPKSRDFFWTQINKKVQDAEYAVRGIVPTTANLMKEEIAQNPDKYPFKQITFCNIGNPHEFHQKPITFNRQVLSCMLSPELLSMKGINPDAAKRAGSYLEEIISAGTYTHSLGIPLVRRSIAKFIARNDDIQEPNIQNIHTTDGASQGVHLLLNTLITCEDDSVMIPIPQYPLYSAALTLYGGHACPYYLNEERGWQLDFEELQRSIQTARSDGKNVKAIVVINPGNPTGAIFSSQTIQKIIQFSVKNKIIIIADQVYRQNIYKKGAVFYSFRKILQTMESKYKNNCELASLHSVSKGLLGQCGLRGGYLYLHNFNPTVLEQLAKLKSISLCSNTSGQAMVELMCNPPIENVLPETKNLFLTEIDELFKSLKHRGELVTNAMQSMQNVTSCEVEGAMYAFPQVKFSKKAIEAAGNQPADLFYCLQVLKNTGIALVPGSGFRQRQNTYHFRITTLILPQQKLKHKLQDFKKFNKYFHQKYQ